MIYAQWTNEFEMGRLFRPPTELMLGLVTKLEPGSILNPVERLVKENVAQLYCLRLKQI